VSVRASTDGLVYYVLDASRIVQYLKIGYTTNLKQRVIDLRGITTSGQSPLVLALEDGGEFAERQRHVEFAELRSHGEWFRYESPLREHVASMDHPFAFMLDRPHLWRWAGGWGPLGPTAANQRPYVVVAEDEHERESDVPDLPPVDF
jgi:hypothetical protein